MARPDRVVTLFRRTTGRVSAIRQGGRVNAGSRAAWGSAASAEISEIQQRAACAAHARGASTSRPVTRALGPILARPAHAAYGLRARKGLCAPRQVQRPASTTAWRLWGVLFDGGGPPARAPARCSSWGCSGDSASGPWSGPAPCAAAPRTPPGGRPPSPMGPRSGGRRCAPRAAARGGPLREGGSNSAGASRRHAARRATK